MTRIDCINIEIVLIENKRYLTRKTLRAMVGFTTR